MKKKMSAEFIYQLFALLVIVIVVHAIYVGVVRPTARAAPLERSSTRPLMKGPRSLTVTTTLLPL